MIEHDKDKFIEFIYLDSLVIYYLLTRSLFLEIFK